MVGFATYVLVSGDEIVDLVDFGGDESLTLYTSAAILIIVVAAVVIIVTFFGCCGAWKENKCMLGTYFTIILVMFICVLVGAVIGVTQSLDFIQTQLTATQKSYGKTDPQDQAITKAWDQVQTDVSTNIETAMNIRRLQSLNFLYFSDDLNVNNAFNFFRLTIV